MKRIMIYQNRSSFIAQDIDFIKCDEYQYKGTIKDLIKMFLFFLKNPYDQYIIFFCTHMTLIPILFAKIYKGTSFIFAGGYDACYIPKLNYGVFDGSFKAKLIKLAYKLADRVIISSGHELQTRLNKHVKVSSKIIYCGIDTNYWKPDDNIERDIDYLTVGNIHDDKTFIRKGINAFILAARILPHKRFVIVNMNFKYNSLLPANITNIEGVSNDNLKKLYNRSKNYCQYSQYESFGICVAEAMSMNCEPNVTDVGIMKYIANYRTTPRERIIALFSLENRKTRLKRLLNL